MGRVSANVADEGKACSLNCGMLLWVMVDGGEEM